MTMMSKEHDVAKSSISPLLFMTLEGIPMTFFLRPGPIKVKLQPLITAGGGDLCRVQQPGAILLMDPTEEGSINETTAHWYVSTNYIIDCITENKQLNLEDYKLDPSGVRKCSTRVGNRNRSSYTRTSAVGRQHYTPEEDAAIINFVSKYKKGIGGNQIWKEMEKQRLTSHSWQSMKSHYSLLSKKDVHQPIAENKPKAQEEENQAIKNQETESEKPWAEDDAAPHTDDTESESGQNCILPPESVPPEIAEDDPAAENNKENPDEADSATSPQPETVDLCTATDQHLLPSESRDIDETQDVIPTSEEIPSTDLPQPISTPEVSTQETLEEEQNFPPGPQLLLNSLPAPESGSGQASSCAEPLSASPIPSRKTKSSAQSPQHNSTAAEEPPSKKARGDDATVMAQVHQAADPRTAQPDPSGTGAESSPQKGGKKREKRKLGILEMATREFESESDGDSDLTEDSHLEPEPENPTKVVSGSSTSDPCAPSESGCERGADSRENLQGTRQNNMEENVRRTGTSLGRGTETAAATVAPAASKAHLFIFDRESQDVESQSVLSERAAAPARLQEAASAGSAHSLSQIQLEEDKQRITKLMEETKQDLVTVTKALLKTSGDFFKARDVLLDGQPDPGTLWRCSDDERLISGDPAARLELQEKYGEEPVAERVVFLELER